MRNKTIVATVLAALAAAIVLALPAGAHNNNNGNDDDDGNNKPKKIQLGVGGKLTVALLERGESQALAEIYASADSGPKVERAMKRGLDRFCGPKKFTTLTFTCVEEPAATPAATPPPTATPAPAPPPATAVPPSTVPAPPPTMTPTPLTGAM